MNKNPSKLNPENVLHKKVLLNNDKFALIEAYHKNDKYCFIGHDDSGRPMKWNNLGDGLYAGTGIYKVDPPIVITGPGMYATELDDLYFIRKQVGDKWLAVSDFDGGIYYFSEYGICKNSRLSTLLVKKADLIDSDGGLFFTPFYMVWIAPDTKPRIIVEDKIYKGKAYSEEPRQRFWNGAGKLCSEQGLRVSTTGKYDIIDKFIPFRGGKKMLKRGAFQIDGIGTYIAKNGRSVKIEGGPLTQGEWYGYVDDDKTNHHVWDKFGRVYTFEDEQWIVGSTSQDLDLSGLAEAERMPLKSKPPKFEIGKRYADNRGGVYMALSIDKKRSVVLTYSYEAHTTNEWHLDGRHSVIADRELVKEYVEPEGGTVWVNIYPGDAFEAGDVDAFISRKRADVSNENASIKRIACVKVDWKEGQFDDDNKH